MAGHAEYKATALSHARRIYTALWILPVTPGGEPRAYGQALANAWGQSGRRGVSARFAIGRHGYVLVRVTVRASGLADAVSKTSAVLFETVVSAGRHVPDAAVLLMAGRGRRLMLADRIWAEVPRRPVRRS
jgi:hypothetical protein